MFKYVSNSSWKNSVLKRYQFDCWTLNSNQIEYKIWNLYNSQRLKELIKTWRTLPNSFAMLSVFWNLTNQKIDHFQWSFQMFWKFWKCFENVLKMFWKCFENVLNISWTLLEHFLNISWTFSKSCWIFLRKCGNF